MYKYDLDGDDDDDDLFAFDPTKNAKDKNPRNNPPPKGVAKNYDPFSLSSKSNRLDETPVRPSQYVKRFKDETTLVYKDENLDDNFEVSPWLPPDVLRAKEYKSTKIYKGAKYESVHITSTSDISIGVNYHFMFMKIMAYGLLAMTFFSIPALLFAFSGQGTPVQQQDILQLYQFTIGNIGTPSSPGAVVCTPSEYATVNNTCITALGSYELPLTHISLAMTITEFVQILIFFITVYHLQRSVNKLKKIREHKRITTATDYTVLVENLPKDTTEVELIKHFSDLYQLERPDWKKRLPVEDARPVQHCDNSGDQSHVGTWVAECSIHKRVRGFILSARRLITYLEELYHYKAKIKMYSMRTVHIGGTNDKKREKAEKQLMKLAGKIDRFIASRNKKYGIAQPAVNKVSSGTMVVAGEATNAANDESQQSIEPTKGAIEGGDNKSKSQKMFSGKTVGFKPFASTIAAAPTTTTDAEHGLDKVEELEDTLEEQIREAAKNIKKPHKLNKLKSTCAFVCFEYNESFARCVEDHAYYSVFPLSLFCPKALRFKGRVLSVRTAPKPHQVVWENIDVSSTLKFILRVRTVLVAIFLIAICLAVLIQAATYKNVYTKWLPDNNMCYTVVPELYTSQADLALNPDVVVDMYFTRPTEDIVELDAQCHSLIPDSFYAEFRTVTLIGHTEISVGNYNFSMCANHSEPLQYNQDIGTNFGIACPKYDAGQYCPCISTSLTTMCSSKGCDDDILLKLDDTLAPSIAPTDEPTFEPTVSFHPTSTPSTLPSVLPTIQPSSSPSLQPSATPTFSQSPSCQPTSHPTSKPSYSHEPTSHPTAHPTAPSNRPSEAPTPMPSVEPTIRPSDAPTVMPSLAPSAPTILPTVAPSAAPSEIPTNSPIEVPSIAPNEAPSEAPTLVRRRLQVTDIPSEAPSEIPTELPTAPTEAPTFMPSNPTFQPTSMPSSPTWLPTSQPSDMPSGLPSAQPSDLPTTQPSSLPTLQPSSQPSCQPSSQPTIEPSGQPTSQPSECPTSKPSTPFPSFPPTEAPTHIPTFMPSLVPTQAPSWSQIPTVVPSMTPSEEPSETPTEPPTETPSLSQYPTVKPTAEPTCKPTRMPTEKPSRKPTAPKPTRLPTSPSPTSNPSSSRPTSMPSISQEPTWEPSESPTEEPTVSFMPTTIRPTVSPTLSLCPSVIPTTVPSMVPTIVPSHTPSQKPTPAPSFSRTPTMPPTTHSPSVVPTLSLQPSYAPSNYTYFDNSTDTYSDDTCQLFMAGDIGKCYCSNTLDQTITDTGLISLLMKLTPFQVDPSDPHCGQVNYDYLMSLAVLYIAVIITAIINAILKRCIMHLVKLECHVFKENVQDSMFIKIFLATYVNMGVVILIAFGSTDEASTPYYFKYVNIFTGPYREFTPSWYGNVGFYLVITFFFHSFVPIAGTCLKYYVGIPIGHFVRNYKAQKRSSHNIVIQRQLDMQEVGPVFDVTTQSAQMLARLFIAMTFAPGIPLLTLLCCVAFVAHFVSDKYFLCWYHEKPVFLTNLVMRRILSLLPYCAILRLCVACWMYSADDVLSASFDSVEGASASAEGYNTNVISLANYMSFVTSLQKQQYLPTYVDFVYHRITRGNVFPIFCLLVLIIAVKTVRKVWMFLPFYWIGKGAKKLLKLLCEKKDRMKVFAIKGYVHGYELVKRGHPLRTEAAPFTGSYFRYNVVRPKEDRRWSYLTSRCGGSKKSSTIIANEAKQTLLERLGEDWEEAELNEFPVLVKVWPVTALTTDGQTKMKGDHKRTYEVIRDEGSYSYDLEKIPGYSILILAWKEFTAEPILETYLSRHPEKREQSQAIQAAATGSSSKSKKQGGSDSKKAEVEDEKPAYKHIKRRKKNTTTEQTEGVEMVPVVNAVESKPEKKSMFGWLRGKTTKSAAKVVPVEDNASQDEEQGSGKQVNNPLKVKPTGGTSGKQQQQPSAKAKKKWSPNQGEDDKEESSSEEESEEEEDDDEEEEGSEEEEEEETSEEEDEDDVEEEGEDEDENV